MFKYIMVVLLGVLLVCNYLSKKILGFFLKTEPTQKQEIIYKSVLYVVILIGAICIMVMI